MLRSAPSACHDRYREDEERRRSRRQEGKRREKDDVDRDYRSHLLEPEHLDKRRQWNCCSARWALSSEETGDRYLRTLFRGSHSFPNFRAPRRYEDGVGMPGDFRFSDVPKPEDYLHTYRDMSKEQHIRMLNQLMEGRSG